MRPIIGGWEPPSIEAVNAVESRRIARLSVAGLSGDLQQDLGRGAMGVQICGSLTGEEARDEFLKQLRLAFYAGAPVDFVAHILEEAELEKVLIERFDLDFFKLRLFQNMGDKIDRRAGVEGKSELFEEIVAGFFARQRPTDLHPHRAATQILLQIT